MRLAHSSRRRRRPPPVEPTCKRASNSDSGCPPACWPVSSWTSSLPRCRALGGSEGAGGSTGGSGGGGGGVANVGERRPGSSASCAQCLARRGASSALGSDVPCLPRRGSAGGGVMAGGCWCSAAGGLSATLPFSAASDSQLLPGSPAGMNWPSAGAGCQPEAAGASLPARSGACHGGGGGGAGVGVGGVGSGAGGGGVGAAVGVGAGIGMGPGGGLGADGGAGEACSVGSHRGRGSGAGWDTRGRGGGSAGAASAARQVRARMPGGVHPPTRASEPIRAREGAVPQARR